MVIETVNATTAIDVREGKTGSPASSRGSTRLEFLDALRVALIVLVVVHHAGQAYGPSVGGLWPVSDPNKAAILSSFFSVNAAFFMALFFLISALFLPASFDHKGPVQFLKDRFVRLGLPLAFVLLVGELAKFAVHTLNVGAPDTFFSRIVASVSLFAVGQGYPGHL